MKNATGYIEGFYGRLLAWPERARIVQHLHDLGMSHYFYAPKEDVSHRLRWRQPYSEDWRADYTSLCRHAASLDVKIIAGVAPGLDFEFAHLDSQTTGTDFIILLDKARQLLADGADGLALLMDDIDEDFHIRAGSFSNEGQAHAQLANRLGQELNTSLWVVPRVYANDIATQSPSYLPAFVKTLATRHAVVHCGMGIIARSISTESLTKAIGTEHRIIVWDNLYANDYCPRRLFLGPFTDRDCTLNLMLNPTGMIETDCFLLNIMKATLDLHHKQSDAQPDAQEAWASVLAKHHVPEVFSLLAPYFSSPSFDGKAGNQLPEAGEEHFAALEQLLWKWKTPLSREWYPWLMALKQDLLLAAGRLSDDRIHKIQLPPLASELCKLHQLRT